MGKLWPAIRIPTTSYRAFNRTREKMSGVLAPSPELRPHTATTNPALQVVRASPLPSNEHNCLPESLLVAL